MVLHSVQTGANLHVPLGTYDTSGGASNPLTLPNQAQAYIINFDTGNTAIQINCVSGTIHLGNTTDTTIINLLGELRVNSNVGTSGQVLTSQGAGALPAWTTVSGGGGSLPFALTDNTTTQVLTEGANNVLFVDLTDTAEQITYGHNAGSADFEHVFYGGMTLTGASAGADFVITRGDSGSGNIAINTTSNQQDITLETSGLLAPITLTTTGTSSDIELDSGRTINITSATDINIVCGDNLVWTLDDNNAVAWRVGTTTAGEYIIEAQTTTGSEQLRFGNASITAFDYYFQGSGDLRLPTGTLRDGTGVAGTSGQVLTSTGTSTLWADNVATVALNDITDVTITGASTGEVLRYSGSAWVDATLSTSDVTEGTNLYYTNTRADARIAAADWGDLGDVVLTAPGNGDLAYYNGANWVNLAAGTSGYYLRANGATQPSWNALTTTAVTEGTNLYYTNTRADARIAAADWEDLANVTITSPAVGQIAYYNGTAWVNLAAGTSGYLLQANGAAAPSWENVGAFDPTDINIADNTAGAFNVEAPDAGNHYININTTTGSELIQLSNATDNAAVTILGTGTLTAGTQRLVLGSGNGFVIGEYATGTIGTTTIGIGLGASFRPWGNDAVVIGENAQCTGGLGVAVGDSANAGSSGFGVAIGQGADTGNSLGIALGRQADAAGSNGIACGYQADNNDNANTICFGRGSSNDSTNQVVFGSASYPYEEFVFGRGSSASAPDDFVQIRATNGSGTNIGGTDIYLEAGRATGSGTGGDIRIRTGPAGTSGTALQTLRDRIIVQADGQMLFNSSSTGSGDAQMKLTTNRVQTTDATATTLLTTVIANSAEFNAGMFMAQVLGSRQTPAGFRATTVRCFVYYDSGAWTIGGSDTIGTDLSSAGGGVSWSISGSSLRLQVTGGASETWDWSGFWLNNKTEV